VKRGEQFDAGRLDESLKNLFATGLFDDVALERRGDVLVVKVVENPIINRIAFEGNRRLDDPTLTNEVQLRPRVVYTRARVQNAVGRILELYRRNGRYAAKVEPKVIQLDQNRVDLVFEIDEGPLTGVGGISFIGNEKFGDRHAARRDPDDRERLVPLPHRQRHLRPRPARLRPGAAAPVLPGTRLRRLPGRLGGGRADPRRRRLLHHLHAGGGAAVPLRHGRHRQPDRGPERRPAPAAGADQSGEVYNGDLAEQTIQRLTDQVGQQGYAFARIEPVTRKNAQDLTVDLTYRIDEGPRVYVERIDVRGNLRTLDEVVRREFRIAEGDAFNTACCAARSSACATSATSRRSTSRRSRAPPPTG
jgi:outer membrane protein insertion porin family